MNWNDDNGSDTMNDWLTLDGEMADIAPPEKRDFDPLPPGWYDVHIDEVEGKPTKNQEMVQAAVRMTVVDGPNMGRVIFTRPTVRLLTARPTDGQKKSLEIGLSQIGQMARSSGVASNSVRDLVGATLKVKVRIKPAGNGFDASNDVTDFRGIENLEAAAKIASKVEGKPEGKAEPKNNRPAFMNRGAK
jgi:hypothetical protein